MWLVGGLLCGLLSGCGDLGQAVLAARSRNQARLVASVDQAKFTRGNRAKKWLALTFDDGPHPGYTEPLLKILREQHVKATFFVVGKMVRKSPWLVRAELAEGHVVGNHSFNHPNITKVPPDVVVKEIRDCDTAIRDAAGRSWPLFRPPGGNVNTAVVSLARGLGFTTVMWTDDPGDYASPGEDIIVQRTLKYVNTGGVLLLHDGIQQTLNVLPKLIQTLRAEGYTFVTVDEMIRDLRQAQLDSPGPRGQ